MVHLQEALCSRRQQTYSAPPRCNQDTLHSGPWGICLTSPLPSHAASGSAAPSAAERARSAHVALPGAGRGRGSGGRLGASRLGAGGGPMKLNAAKLGAKKTDDLFDF